MSSSYINEAITPGVVFIIDDEAMVTSSLKTMLELETGHQVHTFNAPKEALKHLDSLRPDVVISDFLMPGMDGIAFLAEVRKQQPDCTLMLLTGYADKESAIKAINEVGIYRYIEKPWDNEEIKININNALERSQLLLDISQRKEIERLREDFVSTLTHDLRTPLLAGIQTLGFFADNSLGPMNPRQTEMSLMLIQSLRDMLGLVNVLLEVYKYESGRQTLVFDAVDLTRLVEATVQELQSLAHTKDQILTLEATKDIPAVQGDKQELRRVLVNLIGNALHHTPRDGHIMVRLHANKEQVTLSVQDNGRGIPAEDLPKLFQRFAQGTSRKRSSGTGLGLYLSRQIVEAHQGQIRVDSIEGDGATFTVTFPLAKSLVSN